MPQPSSVPGLALPLARELEIPATEPSALPAVCLPIAVLPHLHQSELSCICTTSTCHQLFPPSPSVPPAWASDHPALLLASSSRLCRPHRRRLQRGCPLGGVVFSPRHHLQSLPLLSSCDIPALPAFPIFLPHILCMLEAAYRPLTAVAHSFPAPPPSASCLMASIAWPLISFTCSSSSCFPTFLTFLSWAGSCSECAHLW